MDQEIKHIGIKELILWTENPRDPIDKDATDQDIVDMAFNRSSKWDLSKLAKEMGDYYDFSELPTVVYHGDKPIVYDGNRRIILGKIKHGLVIVPKDMSIQLPEFPDSIPCNVCTKEIALRNVYRKHSDTGSWKPLERDIFLHKFMEEEKSLFLALEEETGIISANPHLNQGFVRDEILKEDILKDMGFSFKDGSLYSIHSDEEGYEVLSDISRKIEQKDITTRKNRGKVIDVLEPSSRQLIDQNKKNTHQSTHIKFNGFNDKDTTKRRSRRESRKKSDLFGNKLYLHSGKVNNFYRDIVDLHQFYVKEKTKLSKTFPNLIRMALRLLCEIAAKDKNLKLDEYLKNNFDESKSRLDKDQKTTLANQNVTKESIVQLLHTGAHQYSSSSDMDQTIALSIMIGAIITITHGK